MEIFTIYTFRRERVAYLLPKMPLELDTAWTLLMRYESVLFPFQPEKYNT